MKQVSKWFGQKETQWVIFWLVGGLIWRGFIACWLYPGFDEAYYFLYSQHLDWSYFDHPVLVAITTGVGPWLTGIVSQFTIRIGTLILHTGSLFLLYLTSAQLFNLQTARLTLAIASIIPIFQIGFGILTLPDSPLIFFWSASLYCAVCEFFPQSFFYSNNKGERKEREKTFNLNLPADLRVSARGCLRHLRAQLVSPASPCLPFPIPYSPTYRLAILGILVGLACLGKYHGFLLGLGLVGFCLTSKQHRRALLSPWCWLGLILFVLTLFPLWWWNFHHDWISFRFQLSTRFESHLDIPKEGGFNPLNIGTVFLAEIGYLFPSMGLPLWWISWRSLAAQFKVKKTDLATKQLLILWVSLPLTIGFTILGGFQPILPTWSQPGFWGLTLLLGHQAFVWQQQSRRRVKQWLRLSAIAITSILLLILLHITTGTCQKNSQYALFNGFVSAKDDPSIELIDIEQLRRGFSQSPVLLEALNNSKFIFTNQYYLGGYISMAVAPLTDIPVTCFGEDVRGFAYWSQPEEWLGRDGLYITLEKFQQISWLTSIYSYYFRNFQEIGTIPIKRGGTITETFHIYRGQQLLHPYPLQLSVL